MHLNRSRLSAFVRAALGPLFALLLAPAVAQATLSAGAVRGRVSGPDGGALPGVAVVLRNDITGFRDEAVTTADGTFAFFDVPFNPYEVHVDLTGFRPVHRPVDVRSSVAPEVAIVLELASRQEAVSVEATAGQLESGSASSHVDVDKSYIARAPAAIASRAMDELVASTPGFAKDENGRFHFQGFHSQSMFVIDGQTISDQTGIQSVFGGTHVIPPRTLAVRLRYRFGRSS